MELWYRHLLVAWNIWTLLANESRTDKGQAGITLIMSENFITSWLYNICQGKREASHLQTKKHY